MPENVKDRMHKLRAEIADHARAYYELDAPTISDAAYDSLVAELRALDAAHPQWADLNFVIYRVGGAPLDAFTKAEHSTRMLSLSDAFSYDEIRAWDARIRKLVGEQAYTYFCELKLDGLAISLIYEEGVLVRAVTRGDGSVGEDVTQNAKTIESISLQIPDKRTIEVRGEVVMSKAILIHLNKKYEKEGRQLLANTRNAAAGSLRQLDPAITRERRLDFFAWDCLDQSISHHSDKHKLLAQLGFMVARDEAVCTSLEEVEAFIEAFEKKRDAFPYGTDGIVIQVNESSLQGELGVVGKAPRYALAYKYPAEQATTTVINISVQVGRTGVLTPLAHFVPVPVAGSTVSKATLHNIEQIERLDVRVGDTVIIQKAGDVIPEVVEVIKTLRPKTTKAFVMPKQCPVCDSPVDRRESQTRDETVAYYCSNDACPARNTRGIIHFVRSLDIYEVGPKIVEKLQDEGLVSDAADLFYLTEADLAGLERMGEKSAKNITQAIADKTHPPLDRFITRFYMQINKIIISKGINSGLSFAFIIGVIKSCCSFYMNYF